MLWMAVKCYLAELLLAAEEAALAAGRPSPLQNISAQARRSLESVRPLVEQLRDLSAKVVKLALATEITPQPGDKRCMFDATSLIRCMQVSASVSRTGAAPAAGGWAATGCLVCRCLPACLSAASMSTALPPRSQPSGPD